MPELVLYNFCAFLQVVDVNGVRTPPTTPPPSKRQRVDKDSSRVPNNQKCHHYELVKFKEAWNFVQVEHALVEDPILDKKYKGGLLFCAWERPSTPHPKAPQEKILEGVRTVQLSGLCTRFEGVAYCPIYQLLKPFGRADKVEKQ